LLYFLIDYKFGFAKILNSTVFNTIIATALIAFYKKQKTLLLIDRTRHIFSSYAKKFCTNKLILFNHKFYKEQTAIKETNLYI